METSLDNIKFDKSILIKSDFKLLIDKDSIQKRVKEIGSEINKEYLNPYLHL